MLPSVSVSKTTALLVYLYLIFVYFTTFQNFLFLSNNRWITNCKLRNEVWINFWGIKMLHVYQIGRNVDQLFKAYNIKQFRFYLAENTIPVVIKTSLLILCRELIAVIWNTKYVHSVGKIQRFFVFKHVAYLV